MLLFWFVISVSMIDQHGSTGKFMVNFLLNVLVKNCHNGDNGQTSGVNIFTVVKISAQNLQRL